MRWAHVADPVAPTQPFPDTIVFEAISDDKLWKSNNNIDREEVGGKPI